MDTGGGYRWRKSVTGPEATCRAHTMQVCLPLFHSTFSLHFLTPLFHCQRSCLSDGGDQQLSILFAELCCLSAGRDQQRLLATIPPADDATFSDKSVTGRCLSLHFFTVSAAVCQLEETSSCAALHFLSSSQIIHTLSTFSCFLSLSVR